MLKDAPQFLRGQAARIAIAVGIAVTLGACGHSVDVTTAASPDLSLSGRSTFRIMPSPQYRGTDRLTEVDPMLDNSITNRALRQQIRADMEARGYRLSPEHADIDIAYYATTAPKLDVRTYDYGYTWRGWPREYTEVNQYEQGTVLIDLVDPSNHQLIWRGRGVAAVSTDPNRYTDELRKAADKIVAKVPGAMPRA